MKSYFFLLFLAICATGGKAVMAQNPGEIAYRAFWQHQDSIFSSSEKSPLSAELLATFDSVARFSFDARFRVEAVWEPLEAVRPQSVNTTTSAVRLMQKAGILVFELYGTEVRLPVYRDLTMARMKSMEPGLFLPFTDLTNGTETYGGGRYLDLKEEDILNGRVLIDFNQAYHPWCVYSNRYSCPVPPAENHVPLAIEAGARLDMEK